MYVDTVDEQYTGTLLLFTVLNLNLNLLLQTRA